MRQNNFSKSILIGQKQEKSDDDVGKDEHPDTHKKVLAACSFLAASKKRKFVMKLDLTKSLLGVGTNVIAMQYDKKN